MGRARGNVNSAASTRRSALTTTIAASGFDATCFAEPDLYGGDFASVVVETGRENDYYSTEGDDYYSAYTDDYYPDPTGGRSAKTVISNVYLQDRGGPHTILLTVMQKLQGTPLVAELERNPYCFYGAVRAAQHFRQQFLATDIEWSSEDDYYGETVKDVKVGPEYAQALAEFAQALEEIYALSVKDENNQIIELSLMREYGRLIPRVANKHFAIKKIAVADIVRRKTRQNGSVLGLYGEELWWLRATTRSKRMQNAGDVTQEFWTLAKQQPVLMVNLNAKGKFDIIDGHHRFTALTSLPKPAKYMFALVAE
jgi:hypothetical protein